VSNNTKNANRENIIMVAINSQWLDEREERIARLTETAYHAVLERGYQGSFLELELSLWRAIRLSVEQADFPALSRANVA
jgi:hypothetical protein